MTDTSWFGQVNCCDEMGGEIDAVYSIGVMGSDGEAFPTEGLRHSPKAAFEGDTGICFGDSADNLTLVILRFWQMCRH